MVSINLVPGSATVGMHSPLPLFNTLCQQLETLRKALESGDLHTAHSAFAAAQDVLLKMRRPSESPRGSENTMAGVKTALSEGDLCAARTAFADWYRAWRR